MKALSFAAIALAICVQAFGQSDYRNGFVITHSHDSISGLVNFRDGGKAYEICDFKASAGAAVTTYGAKEIAAYGFTGDKRFESKTFKAEAGVEQTNFFEVVVRGTVTLYQLRDTYWVQKGSAEFIQLQNNEKESYVDGQRVTRHDNQHIATLNMLLADCPKVTRAMNNLRLDKRSLTKVINDYNNCAGGSSVVFQDEKPWVKLDAGVAAGVNFSTLEFTGTQAIAGAITGSTKSTTWMFGLMLDVLSPRVSERFAFVTGALYSPITYTTESKYKPGNDYLKIELHQVKVPAGIKYMFKGGRVVPFINAGVSFTFNVKSDVTWYEPANSPNIEFLQSQFEVKTTEFGYWGGVGVTVPITSKLRTLIEFRYEHTNGITPHLDSPFLESSINNLQGLVALKF